MNKRDLFKLSEEDITNLVGRKPSYIKFSKCPSPETQLYIVREDPLAICYIKNPSEEAQIEAVKCDGNAIEYIKNPSLEVQLTAIRENPRSICYIKKPSKQVQLEAIRRNCYAIGYIKNPDLEVIEEAVKHVNRVVTCLDVRMYFKFSYKIRKNLFKYRLKLSIINQFYLERIEKYLIEKQDKEYKKIMLEIELERGEK